MYEMNAWLPFWHSPGQVQRATAERWALIKRGRIKWNTCSMPSARLLLQFNANCVRLYSETGQVIACPLKRERQYTVSHIFLCCHMALLVGRFRLKLRCIQPQRDYTRGCCWPLAGCKKAFVDAMFARSKLPTKWLNDGVVPKNDVLTWGEGLSCGCGGAAVREWSRTTKLAPSCLKWISFDWFQLGGPGLGNFTSERVLILLKISREQLVENLMIGLVERGSSRSTRTLFCGVANWGIIAGSLFSINCSNWTFGGHFAVLALCCFFSYQQLDGDAPLSAQVFAHSGWQGRRFMRQRPSRASSGQFIGASRGSEKIAIPLPLLLVIFLRCLSIYQTLIYCRF